MASTRLRRTFKYPTEDDSEGREEMDEQEQSELIENLQTQNNSSNKILYPLLLSLPLISTLPFFHLLFTSSQTLPTSVPLLSILSITSLICSFYESAFLSPYSPLNPSNRNGNSAAPRLRPSDVFGSGGNPALKNQLSPIQQYLPRLIWGLATLIAVLGSFLRKMSNLPVQEYFWLWCLIPGLVALVLEVSSRAMEDVDRGFEALGGMKYDYKGA